ncbi:MAG: transketolase [Chitinophagaceae bacterium]|nr:transketolase [Chitinophagaceae bacterium]
MEHVENTSSTATEKLSFNHFRQEVLHDYKLCCESREASLLGRREVLTGKAKFGIFGDGKEVAQVALAKFFQPGDFLSGYYRDQTIAFATGQATMEEFFSQLYADPNINNEPHSGGRNMNAHLSTPFVDENGEWLDLVNRKNICGPLAPTAAQIPRSVGLALASKLFRNNPDLKDLTSLSRNGNEICFATIGDASTSEGHFWEIVNAAGVLEIPLAIFVWDDGYGISVPRELQTTKGSISEAMKGLQRKEGTNGINIYKVKAWDYAGMCEVFEEAIRNMRITHIPALFHVEEVTQPQGHSTSGSHERYKTPERLEWERNWDANRKFREWIIANALASEEELNNIEVAAKDYIKKSRQAAWTKYSDGVRVFVNRAGELLGSLIEHGADIQGDITKARNELLANREPHRREVLHALQTAILVAGDSPHIQETKDYYNELKTESYASYSTHLYDESPKRAMLVKTNRAEYTNESPIHNGYEIINKYFDELLSNNPRVVAFGEDVGKIGDVNQGFAGLQARHGENRVFDTGIRELTIVGQGIGLAMRGLKPIAEIQYLDYIYYGLQTLSDDAASMRWRTVGRQCCPMIIRTRGHRLEGIWHSGSPMGLMIHSLRGFYICVPRNMVQAVGLYNTLLRGNDPAIMVESLNGYRLKERLPSNILDFTVALGEAEILREGSDITIVSYGSTIRIVEEAADILAKNNVSIEVIDIQTLLPFDVNESILASLKKTNRIIFVDEDVPGGAAGYMYNMVMEKQGGYQWLDVAPRTITGKAHRPSYGSDGDYFSKPNVEEIIEAALEMMRE